MTQTITKNSKVSLYPSQIRKIFDLSNHLADFTEELLEEGAHYSNEFLRGLRQAEKDFKEGRIKKIKSLREIR